MNEVVPRIAYSKQIISICANSSQTFQYSANLFLATTKKVRNSLLKISLYPIFLSANHLSTTLSITPISPIQTAPIQSPIIPSYSIYNLDQQIHLKGQVASL